MCISRDSVAGQGKSRRLNISQARRRFDLYLGDEGGNAVTSFLESWGRRGRHCDKFIQCAITGQPISFIPAETYP